MTDRSIAIGSPDLARLRRRFRRQILLPDQGGYHQARRVWNAMVDRRPAVIARCASPADVAAGLRFGRTHDLEIGVRGGGHSVLGLSVPDGGLMLDLSPMGSVRVDRDRRRAWVGGGALLGALDRATQPFGLATTAGNISHTGVGGLTLGGGMGWLARRYGLACDNVARFQLVGAEGELLYASHQEHPELYWGLRGGGDPALLPSGSLQSYGGAIAAVGEDESAFGHRDALVEFVAVAGWSDPAQDQAQLAAARGYGAVVEPFASGVYVNDLSDEGAVGIRRAYGADTLARLAALKDRYDPGNLFHLNHNIRPRKEQPG